MSTLTIPDDILLATRMTRQEMAAEVAIIFYKHGGSLEDAAEVAGMGARQFAHLLASREIHVDPRHFQTPAATPAN